MAEGQLNIYNVGERGVVLDKSPIHTEDGELLAAQNAMINTAGGLGAIRKRDGIAKINSSALAGQVTGGIGLPLPDRAARTVTYYLALETTSNTWLTSTDGAVFSGVTTPTRLKTHDTGSTPALVLSTAGVGNLGTSVRFVTSARDKLYYPGNDYTVLTTAPTIHVWDGTTDVLLTRIPNNPTTGGLCISVNAIANYTETKLLVAVTDGSDNLRVFTLDTETGALVQIGPQTVLTPSMLSAITVWQGEAWIGGVELSGSAAPSLWHAREGDTTWTQDTGLSAFTSNGDVISLAVFQGNLYVATATIPTGVTAKIFKKTASSGAWTTAVATTSTVLNAGFGPLIVNADDTKLFAFRRDASGSPTLAIMESTDGASWSTSYDVAANLDGSTFYAGEPILDPNGAIYWPFGSGPSGVSTAGALIKRTSAGVWSVVIATGQSSHRGAIGYVRV